MKKVILGLIVVALMIPAAGIAKKSKDITGTYGVVGYDPGVSTSGEPSYTGTLEISQSGGAYILDWNYATGKKGAKKGVGIYSGKVLSVGLDGGVFSYKVDKGDMKGVWAPASGGVFGYEFLEKK